MVFLVNIIVLIDLALSFSGCRSDENELRRSVCFSEENRCFFEKIKNDGNNNRIEN